MNNSVKYSLKIPISTIELIGASLLVCLFGYASAFSTDKLSPCHFFFV